MLFCETVCNAVAIQKSDNPADGEGPAQSCRFTEHTEAEEAAAVAAAARSRRAVVCQSRLDAVPHSAQLCCTHRTAAGRLRQAYTRTGS